MENRFELKFESLQAAVNDFALSLDIDLSAYPETVADTIKNGQIQKFEFCTELMWKTIRMFLLESHGIDAPSPKKTVKEFYNLGYVDAGLYEMLLQGITIRNDMAHIYRKQMFENHYQKIVSLLPAFKTVLSALRK